MSALRRGQHAVGGRARRIATLPRHRLALNSTHEGLNRDLRIMLATSQVGTQFKTRGFKLRCTTGAKAEAWCLLKHADASLSLSRRPNASCEEEH